MFQESELQTPAEREAALFEGFSARLSDCVCECPGLAAHLDGHDVSQIDSRAALQALPVLRKNVLIDAQQANPPFGGFVNQGNLAGQRIFMSPGPVWEPQLGGDDPWQGMPALVAAGIRFGDVVHNAFSYHLTPGGFILDEAARALGCIVFPAGVGNTESQVAALHQTRASVYIGTPDYLQVLLDHASDNQRPLTHIKRAMVSGGALFPAMRSKYHEQGIHVQQCYATADLGVIAFETHTENKVHPGMVVNEGLIVEILVPGTNTAVQPGEVGEVVVTRLHPDYPLLRFATGDLSRELTELSPCGRTNMRLAGWMGRADQRVKVRGMFVDPLQIAEVRRSHKEFGRVRLVVTRGNDRDEMSLHVTLTEDASMSIGRDTTQRQNLLDGVASSLKKATSLTGSVTLVDSLPDDGIVVDDQRQYD